ncbi:mobile mystery protein A [Hyphomicrobium sp. CS1BSMeth3]|uniref:mobile mystery protein A n=1 Tax=Hyphomicrobium sp. CS1BSMeth3 TaxID=1892844 RepID=UPI000930F891|nr:mobile mystery protein A [Hyphomicrobium sp. CS1BSMeth3]
MSLNPTLRAARRALDRQLPATAAIRQLPSLHQGWIAAIRKAIGMPQETLASRLGLHKQRVSLLEQRERSGDIKLSQLRDAADALGCDLVYALLPREPLDAMVQRRARERAAHELAAVERTMQLEDQATGIDAERIDEYIARHITEKDLWRDG